MVRRAEIRKRRYEASLDPEKIARNLAALKPGMVGLESIYLAEISHIEAKTKKLLEAAGVPSYQVAQYLNIGRQCYSLAKKFSGATRDDEATNVCNHWISRGLDPELVASSCRAGGCSPTITPTPPPVEIWDSLFPKMVVGNWYPSLHCADAGPLTTGVGRRTIEAFPYPIPRRMRFDRIGLWITGAVAGNVTLGLYNSDNNGFPSSLLLSADVDVSALGQRSAVIDISMEPGWYYIFVFNLLLGVSTVASQYLNFLPAVGGDDLSGYNAGFYVRGLTLPDPFGTPEGYMTTLFYLGMRVAELL